jgi:hypothetical protein
VNCRSDPSLRRTNDPNEKRRCPNGATAFQLGVDQPAITARGTAFVCLPVDRPHDPGDAADLSIMGYPMSLAGNSSFVEAEITQNKKKINTFLMPLTIALVYWLKSGADICFLVGIPMKSCSVT